MTLLLEKAFEEVSKLPKKEQNALAKWLLEELKTEQIWDKKFAESEDVLDKLTDEALDEYREGKTRNLETDKL